MRDFRRHRASKQDAMRAALGALGVVALLFVALYAAKGAWGMYTKFVAASEADAAAQVELETLRKQYELVGASAQALVSDRGVEAGVRERFGVARPGEGQIDIIRREVASSSPAVERPNVFQKIFRALFVW